MTMSTIEKVLFLKSVPLFEQLHSEELVGVAQIARQVRIEADQTFVKEGDLGDALAASGGGTMSAMWSPAVRSRGIRLVVSSIAVSIAPPLSDR